MSKDTSDPAFPLALGWVETDMNSGSQKCVDVRDVSHGMSLRDYFAAKALQGMMSYPGNESWGDFARMSAGDAATQAYNYADAMLAARAA